MKYKAAIFDMDGTILNTLEDLYLAVNHTMKKFSYPERTMDEVRQFVGNGVDRLIARSLPGGYDDKNFDAAVKEYRAYYSAHSDIKTAPYEGICELIDKLKKNGVAVAIVSNKPDVSVKELSLKYFPSVEYAFGERESDGIRRKPFPDMILNAAEKLSVSPKECVYIGDSEVDVESAANSGMDCITVLWGFRDRKFLLEKGAKIFAYSTDDVYRLIMSE